MSSPNEYGILISSSSFIHIKTLDPGHNLNLTSIYYNSASTMTLFAFEGTSNIFFPKTWKPTPKYFIIGRGKWVKEHNKPFTDLFSAYSEIYSNAISQADKSAILNLIVQNANYNGGFVKRDMETGCYSLVEEGTCRRICAQALRDVLKGNYRSSNTFKQKMRELRQEQVSDAVVYDSVDPPLLRCISPSVSSRNNFQDEASDEAKEEELFNVFLENKPTASVPTLDDLLWSEDVLDLELLDNDIVDVGSGLFQFG